MQKLKEYRDLETTYSGNTNNRKGKREGRKEDIKQQREITRFLKGY